MGKQDENIGLGIWDPGVFWSKGLWIPTSSPVEWCPCWVTGVAGLPRPCCPVFYPPVASDERCGLSPGLGLSLGGQESLPRQMVAQGTPSLERNACLLPAPPVTAHTQEPRSHLVTICLCRIPAPPSHALSVPCPLASGTLPAAHLSCSFSLPLPPAPLPLSTLTHDLSPRFCPWRSSLPILWPSCGLMVQTISYLYLKPSPFFLNSRFCKSRGLWDIFIYLKTTVSQMQPFIFLPNPPSPVLWFRDRHPSAPTIQKLKGLSRIPLLLHLSCLSGHKPDPLLYLSPGLSFLSSLLLSCFLERICRGASYLLVLPMGLSQR